MNVQSALVWLARQLQVNDPGSLTTWLIRLFWLPSPRQPSAGIDPDRIPDPAAWWRDLLGVAPAATWREWLWRLLVLPPQAGMVEKHGWRSVLGLGGQLVQAVAVTAWQALVRVLKVCAWPVGFTMRQLDALAQRIDTTQMNQAATHVLNPLMAMPGLRWAVLLVGAAAAVVVMTTPLNPMGQLLFLLLWWMLSMVLRRLPGRFPGLALATISLLATGRYAWWRLTNTLDFDSWFEAFLGYGLLTAEAYTWLVAMMGFIQAAWPLKRRPETMSEDTSHWPTVDVFIPTYNEPVSVLRPTVLAAMALDWPPDKLRVYILDDGRRPLMREFAESVGVAYRIRPDNFHAKAGNLNFALQHTDGELVAIFDCDHIPTRSFLKTTAGWFQRDPQLAMLQTPHHFFSPDPFERNLGTFRTVPNEGALFYGLLQDGSDFWNATFFCGSCAVLRRKPLMEVGGIAVETVTEDAHTALKMQRRGYNTAYINEIQAAGLATESLSAHVGQRIRWARGMAQIFRTDNPFLGKGLNVWQRMCYANAMLHFFFGLPRLVFLTAPLAYLFFGLQIMHANAAILALYVVPYILQANLANAHIQGKYRHSFWAEVYETVLAWYVALPTTVALINPRLGTFNVTAKGGLVANPYFDWMISRPNGILAALNLAALLVGLFQLFSWNSEQPATIVLNLFWTSYNLLILGAALGVASESRQVRRTHRVMTHLPATLYMDNGQVFQAECIDFSMTGVGLKLGRDVNLAVGERVQVGLMMAETEHTFPAHVVLGKEHGMVGLELDELDRDQQIALVQCTFARPNAWHDWGDRHEQDRPLQGLKEIAQLGLNTYQRLGVAAWQALQHHFSRRTLTP